MKLQNILILAKNQRVFFDKLFYENDFYDVKAFESVYEFPQYILRSYWSDSAW